jgi:hypothetical protein
VWRRCLLRKPASFIRTALMMCSVDETQSSTVWAQDKWKGIFKVKWIFVRDVPSA